MDNWIKYAANKKVVKFIPENYQHPADDTPKRVKSDRNFIERQMKVKGYRCDLGAFYFITNDPRTTWI